ncbi:hypothetical protein ACOSQ3_011685 [Xanthoceras sorbifolium]
MVKIINIRWVSRYLRITTLSSMGVEVSPGYINTTWNHIPIFTNPRNSRGFRVVLLLGNMSEAAITCGTVNAKAAACVAYATGKAAKPPPACCTNLQQLAQSVKSVKDKKDICRCLKAAGKSLGVQDRYLTKIPGICKINVGFSVSTSTDCEKIR